MDIHIRTGALLLAFSFSIVLSSIPSQFCSLSLSFSYTHVYRLYCIALCIRYCTLLPALQYANPFFVERYDTLLMLHFRFATRMAASIWLCLVTNTHTQFNPSHFHHNFFSSRFSPARAIAICRCWLLAPMRVFHCRSSLNIFLSFHIGNITEEKRIEGCFVVATSV